MDIYKSKGVIHIEGGNDVIFTIDKSAIKIKNNNFSKEDNLEIRNLHIVGINNNITGLFKGFWYLTKELYMRKVEG